MTRSQAPPPALPEEVLRLFDGKLRMGYVATVRPDGHLAVVPVGTMIRDGEVCISSPAETHKVGNLAHDRHIAVCVPDPDDARRYAMIRGIAEVVPDEGGTFLDWLARTHMGLEEYPRHGPAIARVVIAIKAPRCIIGGVHEGA